MIDLEAGGIVRDPRRVIYRLRRNFGRDDGGDGQK